MFVRLRGQGLESSVNKELPRKKLVNNLQTSFKGLKGLV
jgi:hypothetical protein